VGSRADIGIFEEEKNIMKRDKMLCIPCDIVLWDISDEVKWNLIICQSEF
jgi:hypothetical protein